MMGDYDRFTGFGAQIPEQPRGPVLQLPSSRHPHAALRAAGQASDRHGARRRAGEAAQRRGQADDRRRELPWAYCRLFFHGKDGKLSSIDLLRSSPVGGAVTDVPAQGVHGLSGLIAPELQPVLDMIYGQTASGQKVPNNAFSRSATTCRCPTRTGSGRICGSARRSNAGQHSVDSRASRDAQDRGFPAVPRGQGAGVGSNRTEDSAGALGLYPKPDNSAVVAAHQLARTAGSSSSGGGWGGSSSAGSGGWGSAASGGGWG